MKKKLRNDIKQKDVVELLGITDEQAQKAAKYCDKHAITGLCCECPHFKLCQRVNDELLDRPLHNGKPIGAFFFSDLLYYMNRGGAVLR